ncbi:hypothetical protein AXE65_09820 [Ventosimonas gracilis]|uniref:Sel1 repeat family protein n=2 Tax=Ventosimonas gracilis TaxID=1680762 RepID=A0A139SX52_9GAMM|nr:hypothetical protein AXE65_09820 [Ventosimonas gracilis]
MNAKNILQLLSILLLSPLIPAFAGDWTPPRYYYEAPQSLDAFKTSQALAKKGDALAQYSLCLAYRFGKYVQENTESTLFWCKKAADQGLAQAQNYLGYMYLNGNMVKKDYAQALHWFQIANAQNYKDAQYYLGQMYDYALGVNPDHDKAIYLYQLSAAQNDHYAKKALDEIRQRYRNFEKNLPWARQGDRDAQWHNSAACFGLAYRYRELVIREECSEAIDWLTSAAEQGDSFSQRYLAEFYLQGKHVEQNYQKALYLFQRAAEQGNSDAQRFIGTLYEKGLGVDKNQNEAERWYQLASERGDYYRYSDQAPYLYEAFKESQALAKKGDALAQYTLCLAYRFGKHVRKNAESALLWCKKAADQELPQAQNFLGYMYLKGYMVKQDYAQALHWFQLASAQHYRDAQYYLGHMYDYGWGVNPDHDKAIHLYQLSVAQNYAFAKNALYDIRRRYRHFEKNLPLARQGDKMVQWHHSSACLHIYRNKIIHKECSEAINWLTSAAEQGHWLSQLHLAQFYLQGKHVEQNYQKALYFFQRAVVQEPGDSRSLDAQYLIGTLYEKGLGTDKNLGEAIRWYQLAAKRGHPEASRALKRIHQGPLRKWFSKTFLGH